MKSPAIVRRHPELRWLATTAVLVAVGAIAATTLSAVFRSDAALTATSPQQLVAKVQSARPTGYSGTVISRVDLGLPPPLRRAISKAVPFGGNLLDGAHALRFWYGGPTRQRTAVVDRNGEQDVFRNGNKVLLWDTRSQIAVHTSVRQLAGSAASFADPASLTPPQLAIRLLGSATPTETTLRSGPDILERETYELDVRPDPAATRIRSIEIDVDGAQAVPLRVRVFAEGIASAVIDSSFSSISFLQPALDNFTFTPPANAKAQAGDPLADLLDSPDGISTSGSGWLTVVSFTTNAPRAALLQGALGSGLEQVSGRWGTGRVLTTPLLCMLVTDQGRVLAGAVDASYLVAQAGR